MELGAYQSLTFPSGQQNYPLTASLECYFDNRDIWWVFGILMFALTLQKLNSGEGRAHPSSAFHLNVKSLIIYLGRLDSLYLPSTLNVFDDKVDSSRQFVYVVFSVSLGGCLR
jgi:hypothetical protein